MAVKSKDGTRILENYDSHTGVPFNAKIVVLKPNGDPYTDADVDSGIIYKNTTEMGGGYSKRDYEGAVNVKWFGAMGDGEEDDTIPIQKALSYGGRTFFPDGTYKITGTLLFLSNHYIEGSAKGSVTIIQYGGGIPIFQAATQATATTFHAFFFGLTLNNIFSGTRPMVADSIGIDLRETSQSTIMQCRFRYHQYAIRLGNDIPLVNGGFYNRIIDYEVSSNDYGIYLGISANATVIDGGRINGNEVGIYIGACSGNRINTTMERNNIAVEFADGSFKNTITGGYFEGNGQYQTGLLEPPSGHTLGGYAPGYGAIVFRDGAKDNTIMPCKMGNVTDMVLDFDGRNSNLSLGNSGSSGANIGNGTNLLTNPIMDRDTDLDGLADGWLIDAAIPAGTTAVLDTTVFQTGSQSQRITTAAGGTSKRSFYRQLKDLVPGLPHTVTIVTRIDYDRGCNIRCGDTLADSNYANIQIRDLNGEWQITTFYFVPTGTEAVVYIHQLPAFYEVKDNNANLWIDRIKVETGMFSTAIGNDTPLSGFSAYRATTQAINATTFTKVQFATVPFDNSGEYNSTTNRFQAIEAGNYTFATAVEFASLADGTRTIIAFYKNGLEYKRVHDTYLGATGISSGSGSLSIVPLDKGDYIEVFVYTSIASTVNSGEKFTWFEGVKL